jgi:putative phosphoribosyl transferase
LANGKQARVLGRVAPQHSRAEGVRGVARTELPFHDRRVAGKMLALALARYGGRDDVLVLALPRGGVPVACEVAAALQAPVDLLIVRKLGVPWHEELAMGALASGGARVLNEDVIASAGIRPDQLERVTREQHQEIERREQAYRGSRSQPEVKGKCAILVDDGIATGATMRVAVQALRQRGAVTIVVAVPVAPAETVERLRVEADEVVCLATPDPFHAVGIWYADFRQVSDDEVRRFLAAAWSAESATQ